MIGMTAVLVIAAAWFLIWCWFGNPVDDVVRLILAIRALREKTKP